ncbi:MOSC domain-containing protein [Salinifilum aidingensis]
MEQDRAQAPRGGAPDGAAGSVAQLHRWPVKSLRGEAVDAARFDGTGMTGDRAYALLDGREKRSGKVLTVRQNAAMLRWGAGYGDPVAPAEPPVLVSPAGERWSWSDPGLGEELSTALGVPARPHAAPGQQDRGPSVLVTFAASLAALAEELGTEVDLLRFRPNLHVDADLPAFAEAAWQPGTTLTTGEVVLRTSTEHTGPCVRCAVPSWDRTGGERWPQLQSHLIARHDNLFGVIMDVVEHGVVRRGDAVHVAEPAASDAVRA